MGNDSDVVIKVKYGDALRRIRANVWGHKVCISMDELRALVVHFFKLDPNVDLILTYVDQDRDTVMLVEDSDLYDAVISQHLNPLRVYVSMSNNTASLPQFQSGSPVSLMSPLNETRSIALNTDIEGLMKSMPEPFRDSLSAIINNLMMRVSSSAPLLNEIVASAIRSGLKSMGQVSEASDDCMPKAVWSVNLKSGKLQLPVDSAPLEVPDRENVLGKAQFDTFKDVSGLQRSKESPLSYASLGAEKRAHSERTANFASSMPPRAEKMLGNGAYNHEVDNADVMVPPVFSSHEVHSSSQNLDHDVFMPGSSHISAECDNCDMFPDVGPRFRPKICFSEKGNKGGYTRSDYQSHAVAPFDRSSWSVMPSSHGQKLNLQSQFVKDVTILDGTYMEPLTIFTKIWQMRNNGSGPWPCGTQLVYIGGDKFSDRDSVDLEIPLSGLQVGGVLDIAVDFTAPLKPRSYVSYWRMVSPFGQLFGHRVWVAIQVDSPHNDSSPGTSRVSLNLPPENRIVQERERVVAVNIKTSETGPTASDYSYITVKQTGTPATKYHGSFTTSNGISSDKHRPIYSDNDAMERCPTTDGLSEPVEETLLKMLEGMGFHQIDLNKKVLLKNQYDIVKSIDDLCIFSEWGHILEEMEAMGFSDRELNEELLLKHGGSIICAVKDLIAE